jgi:DNA-binding response OmpR family regulator
MSETPAALTIMIADDDELIRKVVTIYFGGRGYRVVAVASGHECLAQLRLGEPDALLLDVTMPGMDGWEVCRRTREFSALPIIMLTARAQESDREMGVAVGANAYVTKPVSLKELEARVRALVVSRVL